MNKILLLIVLLFSTIFGTPKSIHRWNVIATKNFDIVYNPEYISIAKKVSKIAESTYKPMSKAFGYAPPKTTIILRTQNDQSNAFATPFPWRIELFVNRPVDNWLGANDDYLKTVFIHEYTHILNKRRKGGFTSLVSWIVGQNYVLIHNLGEPMWYQEGLAVYFETKFTNSGRLRNPYQLALMDGAFNKTKWDYKYSYDDFAGSFYWQSMDYRTLYESNFYSRRDLPSGMYYDYGMNIIDYVSDKYGEGVWRKALEDYAKNPFFSLNIGLKARLEQYTKTSIEELDYNSRKKYNKPNLDIENRDDELINYYNPRWDNGKLYAYKDSYRELPSIVEINPNKERKIYKYESLNSDNSYDINGSLITTSKYKIDVMFEDVIYNKIELNSKKDKRFIKMDRIFSPDISPISSKIVAVKNTPDSSYMVVFNEDGKFLERIILENEKILNPRWSNDETKIVYTSINQKSNYNIKIYDLKDKTTQSLYKLNNNIDNNACFSDDDNFVFFNSDRSGKPNIWAVNLLTQERFMVTDEQFSAMAPDIEDGKLAFITYTVNGYRVLVKDISDYNFDNGYEKVVEDNPNAIVIKDKIDYKNKKYNPFKYIYPNSWGLIYDGEYLGVGASGNDPLRHHLWSLSYALEFENWNLYTNVPRYQFYYGYHRFWPKFNLNLDYKTEKLISSIQKYLVGGADLQFPLTLESGIYTTKLNFMLSSSYYDYYYRNIFYSLYNNFFTVEPAVAFNRLSYTKRKIVPNSGVAVSSAVGYTNKDLGYDEQVIYNYSSLSGYVPLFGNHITLGGHLDYQYYDNKISLLMYDNVSNILPYGHNSDDIDSSFYNYRSFIHPKLEINLPVLAIEKQFLILPIFMDYMSFTPFVEAFFASNKFTKGYLDIYRGVGLSYVFANSIFQTIDIDTRFIYTYDWENLTSRFRVDFSINY